MELDGNQKVAINFCCLVCDYTTSKKYNYDKHMSTWKHVSQSGGNEKKVAKVATINCDKCGFKYVTNSGLWKHKQKCKAVTEPIFEETPTEYKSPIDKEGTETIPDLKSSENLIQYLLKENSEFKNLIMELVKKDFINNTNNNINNINNNVNSHNKSFCLNVFLNDTCKGAMNMSEFVDTIKIQMSDLENFAHMDYPDGVSKILLKNLNNLDINLRPIHCSDLKREVLYVKNEDKWTKEEDTAPIFKSAIKQVANKNIRQIPVWREEHPTCLDPQSKQNDVYLKIVSNSMSGGSKEEMDKNYDKIVKNIAKEVTIEKK